MSKPAAKFVRGPGRRSFRVSRPLCGASPEEFASLLVEMAPWVAAREAIRDNRPGRKRVAGAGKRAYPLQFRLLVALVHLRLKTSLRETAAIFDRRVDRAHVPQRARSVLR